jgi:uncharacterized protein
VFFFHDPFYLILSVVGMALVFLPQLYVKSTFRKFSAAETYGRRSGREIAESILREQGVYNVQVEMSQGFLSDHYDPFAKRVRLSPDNYHGASVAAAAVSAHEVGHAIQHARGFGPVVWRGALFPAAQFGSSLGPWLLMGGLALGAGAGNHSMGELLAWVGVALFGASACSTWSPCRWRLTPAVARSKFWTAAVTSPRRRCPGPARC